MSKENAPQEMAAVEYLKAKARMTCRCIINCSECGLSAINNHRGVECKIIEDVHPEEAVAIIQKWAEEHPAKTRQSEFLKMFPNAKIERGVVDLCPKYTDHTFKVPEKCSVIGCNNCRKEYWLSEVE